MRFMHLAVIRSWVGGTQDAGVMVVVLQSVLVLTMRGA